MTRVTCPACNCTLRVGGQATKITCPRCLAEVDLAGGQIKAGPPRTSLPDDRPADSFVDLHLCPGCRKVTEKGWRVCPFCAEPLTTTLPLELPRTADDDVRRDTRGTRVGLTILGVLGGLGLCYFFARNWNALGILSPLVLIIPAGIGAGIAMMARAKPSAPGSGRPAMSGCLMAILVVLATIGAIFIVFFVACMAMLSPGGIGGGMR